MPNEKEKPKDKERPAHEIRLGRIKAVIWGNEIDNGGFRHNVQLRRIIDKDLRSLGAMPWDWDDETLDPKAGSCVNCEKRSSKQPMLFAEADSSSNGKVSKNDRCLDPQCFARKQVAHLQGCESKLRLEHPDLRLIQIGFESLGAGIHEAFRDRIAGLYHPTFVKPGDPRGVPAMQMDGPKAGKLVFVDMGESIGAGANGRHKRPRDESGRTVPMTLDERRARLQKRRDAYIVKHVHELLRNLTLEKALEIVSPGAQRRAKREAGTTVYDPVALLTAFGNTKRADFVDGGEAWKEYDSLCASEPTHEAATALLAVAQVWIKRLNIQGGHTVTAQAEDARRICQILGIDFLAIFAEARRAIPQPKSWPACSEPDPSTISTEPIGNDSQTDEESSATEYDEGDVLAEAV